MPKPRTNWRIVHDREPYDALSKDERFAHLIALARCVNCMRFAQIALQPIRDDDSPSGIRQRLNSFLYTSALLFEGRKVAQWLAKHFRNSPGFEAMQELLKDQEFSDLVAKTLKPLRNVFAFHFQPEEILPALADHESDELVFVRGQGNTVGQTYYSLADAIALRTMIGKFTTNEEWKEKTTKLFSAIARLAPQFTLAADELIARTLFAMGWRMEEDDPRDQSGSGGTPEAVER